MPRNLIFDEPNSSLDVCGGHELGLGGTANLAVLGGNLPPTHTLEEIPHVLAAEHAPPSDW